jgi:two-component system NtrC family sensor kinase
LNLNSVAAHLPNALIGLLPARLQEFHHRQGDFVPRMLGRAQPGCARLKKCVGHLPKDIQLILFVSGIPGSDGDRFFISRQPLQFQLREPALAAKAVNDVKFRIAIVLAIGLLTSATTSRVDREIHLYEVTSKFLFEVDQARRFEKNFFLHGTNLDDALEQAHSARRILRENADGFGGIVGPSSYNQIGASLQAYEDRLTSLSSTRREDPAGLEQIRNAEVDVRKNGRDIVTFATDLVEKEREELEKMISFSRHVQLYLLIFLLLYMVVMSYMLIRRIVDPIGRYMEYLGRIARGDYSPILPRRRYRDEFSALAIAINHMVEELGRRESVLVESHKLRAVGTLTAGVAHELNNPINNITLTSHLLLEDYASLPDAERHEMITDIIHEAERTKKIVGALLDFTRQSESKVEPLDLAEVVKQTLALSHNQLHLKGVRATLEVAPHLPWYTATLNNSRRLF